MRFSRVACLFAVFFVLILAASAGADSYGKYDQCSYYLCKKDTYKTENMYPTVCPSDKEWVSKKVDSINATVRQQVDVQKDKDAGLCYSKCPSGFTGVGPVCWKPCPSGYHDDGAVCRRDAHIFGKANYSRGVGKAQKINSKLQLYCPPEYPVNDAGLCYVNCKNGYRGVGPVCWQNSCPSGYHDDGATCRRDVHIIAKESKTRGAGTVPTLCKPGFSLSGGWCYKNCKDGYNTSTGWPYCTTKCGQNTKHHGFLTVPCPVDCSTYCQECGNYCSRDAFTCQKLVDFFSKTSAPVDRAAMASLVDRDAPKEYMKKATPVCKK